MSSKDPFANATLCTHCGYCLPVCPTYRCDNDETHSPRGRVSIILAVRSGTLSPREATETLSRCLLCRACHVACPAGVKPAKLISHLRGQHPLPPLRLTRWLHRITNHHPRTRHAARLLRWYQASGLQTLLRRFRFLRFWPSLEQMEALLPAHRIDPIPAWPDPPSTPTRRVALLCGCMARLFHPRTAPATANLLNLAGCEVVVPDGFGCCGAPYRENGDKPAFVTRARATLAAFAKAAPVDAVICDSAICAVTVQGYARTLGSDPQLGQAARELAAKVVDLATFLGPLLASQGIAFGPPDQVRTIAYHDHCQTRFGSDIIEQPRKWLEQLPVTQRELVTAGTQGSCCGAGGEYLLRHAHHSQTIRADKLATIMASGAEVVAASNPGCILHLESGLRTNGANVAVRHITEIFWNAYLNRPDQPNLKELP
ncbi:MAG: (Fe-S)-binding protein [Magnetococcales bacterium]|nr:(Fe-S)-binding protein [Magnetococcales bacterium]